MGDIISADYVPPLVLNARSFPVDDDYFYQICRDNDEFRLERTPEGNLIAMAPTSWSTGRVNLKLSTLFESST